MAQGDEKGETKPGAYSRVERPPYMEDIHMETPRSSPPTRRKSLQTRGEDGRGPYDNEDDDDDEDWTGQQRGSHPTNNCNSRLSLEGSVSARGQVLEIRTHAPLEKIAKFEGRRYRSYESLECIKTFPYDMKGTRKLQNDWCDPFSLSLGKSAKSWYRQLSKKT